MSKDNLSKAKANNVIAESYKIFAYVYDIVLWFLELFTGGERNWRRKFCRFIDPNPGENIAELCCGTGAVTLQLAKYADVNRIAACDLSPHQIRVAIFKARTFGKQINYSIQDASATSYASSHFDKVVISGALHEIRKSHRNAIYKEVKRLLKSGGLFYISEPIPQGMYARLCFKVIFSPINPERETALELIDGGLERELIIAGFNIEGHEFTNFGVFKNVKCSNS